MGLKSGSSGDPFDDEPETDDEESVEPVNEDDTTVEEPRETPTQTETTSSSQSTDSDRSLPYIHRRSKVNEGRDQVPFFLREFVRDGEDDLRAGVEEQLGESVPKSDIREAAMLVAQENEELVAAKLREWGYDY